MQRIAIAVVLGLLVPGAGAARAQTAVDSASDTAAIRQAALDYIEGWFEGDAVRMERALHPELAKRIVRADSTGGDWISSMGASQLVAGSRAGFGREVPAAEQKTLVTILDVFATESAALPPPGDRLESAEPEGPGTNAGTVGSDPTLVAAGADSAAGGARRPASLPLRSHGEVRVVSRVVGFKKIKFYTNENVGSGELDLPEQQMHTTAYWLTLPRDLMASLPYGLEERRDGVVGLAFAMKQVAQLLLMCDRHDIGISIGAGDEGPAVGTGLTLQDLDEPRVFVYDSYPGGIGFSEPLFAMHDELVAQTRLLIAGCSCDHGCPTCVGPVGETGPEAKPVALLILDRLMGRGA